MSDPSATDRSVPALPPWLAWTGFAVLALGISGAIQFVFAQVPSDADTAYHAAVGRLIAEHGFLKAFPWTTMSWLADHYADKELLFHLLFVPLTGLRGSRPRRSWVR